MAVPLGALFMVRLVSARGRQGSGAHLGVGVGGGGYLGTENTPSR